MRLKQPSATAPAAGHAKRSLFSTLFIPRLGPSISPLRETTRIFLHLLAGVFSIYGLIPRDYPGLRDEAAPMRLSDIIATAWTRIEFTRAGLPRAIMFFSVLGIMGFSAVMCVMALLGVVSVMMAGHAHAQVLNATASEFQAGTQDLAQSWLQYLFIGPSTGATASFPIFSDNFGDTTAAMRDPFAGSVSLQSALIAALGMYSNAILVVAAFILFYHLTAMIVETAHHGVPMGKRASQIWAPIRLVVAIGLLVPINSGLNCGQFLVIKMAELGSAFASNVWDKFLDQLVSYNTKPVAPTGPIVQLITLDLIKMQACALSWNTHVTNVNSSQLVGGEVSMLPKTESFTMGNVPGTKYYYSTDTFADSDFCGSYFIPSGGSNALANAAATAQAQAISATQGEIKQAANGMNDILCPETPGCTATSGGNGDVTVQNNFTRVAGLYQQAVNNAMANLAVNQKTNMQTALDTLKPYGWVMAGATLNTIDRMQGGLISAAADSVPVVHPPDEEAQDNRDRISKFHSFLNNLWNGSSSSDAWDIRKSVAKDVKNFDDYMAIQISSDNTTNTTNAQCAAMIGLNADSHVAGAGRLTGAVDYIFGLVDYIAGMNGVWQSGGGATCGTSANPGPQTFTLGIQFDGTDPFAQMAYLGHANLNVSIYLASLAIGSSVGGGIISGVAGLSGALGGVLGGMGGLISGAGSLLSFMALLFFVSGFTLAYLVPLMPFLRFFFSVLSWVAAIIEAVVAMPLVALAHLNPEGDGLPGQSARSAYYFVFNLALRPVLMIFGFICGYIVFLIALSFLNYAYAIAVAGAGGTAYGHAAMARIVYSILYVAVVYVCANQSFALIDHLPQHAMQWMGGQAQAMPQMGDAGKIESIASVVSSYGGQQLLGQLQSFSGAIGNGIGAVPKGMIDKHNKKKDDEKFKPLIDRSNGNNGNNNGNAGHLPRGGGPGSGGPGSGGAGGQNGQAAELSDLNASEQRLDHNQLALSDRNEPRTQDDHMISYDKDGAKTDERSSGIKLSGGAGGKTSDNDEKKPNNNTLMPSKDA